MAIPKLTIKVADFEDAWNLKSAIFKAAMDAGFDVTKLIQSDISNFDVNSALKAFVAVDASPVVFHHLWKCLARCTYRDNQIKEEMFAEPEMRKLFYPIAVECIKANLVPLCEGLLSGLGGISSLRTRFGTQK